MDGSAHDEAFIQLMVANFQRAFINPGGPHVAPDLSLLSAKTSALAARASCGTFFDLPDVSGWQNITYARAAIEHLRDAGLTGAADVLWHDYMSVMACLPTPYVAYVARPLRSFNSR